MGDTDKSDEQRLIAGRYRLRERLGQGSMGVVWAAYDEFLHRPVAVKEVLLPPGIPAAEADELRERTLREARAIAALSHQNVIMLHDVAREDGEPFVVMEYLQARSLAELGRANGPLDTAQAAAIGDAVAAALQAAHGAGITHRDVKPGNVLVGTDGRVKLTDFGISRNISERTLTRTGIMLGSPAFIAPEIASGAEVTPAADLWSLGALLFAVVEGHAPYDVNAPALTTIYNVVNGEVPQPETTGPLREVISGLMVKDPQARISLAEVRRRLHPLLPEPGQALFTPEQFAASAPDEPADAEPGTVAEQQPVDLPPIQVDAPPSLAPAPGPLPFKPVSTQPKSRSVLATVLIGLLSVLLFVGGAAGGFAATRKLGGKDLLPPPAVSTTEPTPAPVADLFVRRAEARSGYGDTGGGFSLLVPYDWATFAETLDSQAPSPGSPGVKLRFVAADGQQELTVERLRDYPGRTSEQYVTWLRKKWGNDFSAQPPRLLPPYPKEKEQTAELLYTTVERSSASAKELHRSSWAHLIPIGTDLWVVTLTVPIELESTSLPRFNKIASSFTLTG